jgi:hypothetical protein
LAGQRPLTPTGVGYPLYFGLLGHFQGIIDLDAEVADRTLQLGVPEQQLNGPKILGPVVDQGRLRSPECVRAVAGLVQSQLPDPGMRDPRVLPSR